MGWLEGVLSGYAKRHYEIADEKRREAELAAAREERVFQTLLQSPYKDVKDYALAGMLDLSNPRRRKGGVAGWMGEIEQTPYLAMIQRARERIGSDPEYAESTLDPDYYPWLGRGGAGTEQGGAPPPTPSISTPAGSVAGPPPGAPPAALPSTSQVTGTPGPTPTPAPPPPAPPPVQADAAQALGAPPPFRTRFDYGSEPPVHRSTMPIGGAAAPAAGDPGFAMTDAQLQAMGGRPGTIDPGLAMTDDQLRAVGGRPGNIDPGFTRGAPAGVAAPPPAPPGGPSVAGATYDLAPAGPPLPVSQGPPQPPGLVAAGQPGATTRPVGPRPAVRPSRTQLPGIIPSPADLQRQQARAAIRGKVDAYADMYMAKGFSEQEAYAKAADLLEQDLLSSGRGSALQNMAMEFDVTHPDGRTERVLGWQDRRTQQFLDVNGRPFASNVKIAKAAPYSAFTGDVYAKMAMTQLGIHPGQIATDAQKALQVNELAKQLAGDRANHLTAERGEAAAERPINAESRAALTQQYQRQWNSLSAPTRNAEMFLRTMRTAYDRYKAGDRTAWEPLRTAFVHVSEPNSVVMPSEFTRAAGVGSLLERIYGYIGKTVEGGAPLPDEQVDEMMRIASAIWRNLATYGAQQRAAIEVAISDPRVAIPTEAVFGPPNLRYDPDRAPDPTAAAGPPAPPVTPPPVDPNKPVVPGGTGTYWDPKLGKFVTPPPK